MSECKNCKALNATKSGFAGSSVGAATTPSRSDVTCKARATVQNPK